VRVFKLCLASLLATAPVAAQGRVVAVRATDYKFDAPATAPAGALTFRLQNDGREVHHLWLVQLRRGKSYNDFVNAMESWSSPRMPDWAVDVGGPNEASPGLAASATVTLEPGLYAMVCYVPSADGRPHVMKGMVKPLRVVADSGAAQAVEPRPDVTITMADYSFDISKPITAGQHVVRIDNTAAQSHELVLGRLLPGKTMSQALEWLNNGQKGPAPVTALGGASGLAKGRHQFITATFEPGTYVLLCFVPDVTDAKPHTAHGMAKEFTVPAARITK
jgi:hypothetical protein